MADTREFRKVTEVFRHCPQIPLQDRYRKLHLFGPVEGVEVRRNLNGPKAKRILAILR